MIVMIFFIICISIFFGISNGESANCSSAEESSELKVPFPSTSFTCWGKYDGYYADMEVDCTIFHYCQTWHFPTGFNETVKWDFACPTNTIFNQKLLSCTPPNFSFDCQKSADFYWVNYNFTATPTSPVPTPPITSGTESAIAFDQNQDQHHDIGNHLPETISYPKESETTVSPTSSVQNEYENDNQQYQHIQDGLEFEYINLPVKVIPLQ